jgi:hypothetical protein
MTQIAFPQNLRLGPRKVLPHHDDASHSNTSAMTDDLQQQIFAVKQEQELQCIKEIKDHFRKFGVRLSRDQVFRYANFHNFRAEEAIDSIREDNHNPYLHLKMEDLEEQFLEFNALFPIPDLKSRRHSEVVYMRPSRYFNTSNKSCDKFVETLCYVLNDLSKTEEQCRRGVTVIADMQGLRQENFTKDQYKKIIRALQGDMVPTRVVDFLIVSPPLWFGKTLKHMKSKMTKDFRGKVHVIKEEERLSHFFMRDFKIYLPEDFVCRGLAVASEIAEDYVDLKMMQEQKQQQS